MRINMSRQDRKKEAAFRIMEALSGVDEELLAGCEAVEKTGYKKAAERAGRKKRYLFAQRYQRAAAAVLCLAVLGSAFYGIRHLGGGSTGSAGTADSAAESVNRGSLTSETGEGAETTAEMAAAVVDESGEEQTAQTAEDTLSTAALKDRYMTDKEFAELYEEEKEELKWFGLPKEDSAEDTGKSLLQGSTQDSGSVSEQKQITEEAAETESMTATADRVQVMTWEEASALETFADYIPRSLPAGYSSLYAVCDTEDDSLVLAAEDGSERVLWMKLRKTTLSVDSRIDADPPVFTTQEDWKALLPEADGDGKRQFGLLFDDGMLVEYRGDLAENEIAELMGGIGTSG
jgi:hypothetical protein